MKSDLEIQEAVLDELRWDTRVDHTGVTIAVEDGVVTLTGSVGSFAERAAAEQAAHRVVGVLDVANDVRVDLPGSVNRSDTEIAHEVRRSLEWHVAVPHERITCTVRSGWVTLEGSVEFLHQREEAEYAVRNLEGVRGVTSRITVLPPKAEEEEVEEAIEHALERRAERSARHIGVAVRDGLVTLTGTVTSWSEKRAVVGAARHTAGVQAVEDDLEVEPVG